MQMRRSTVVGKGGAGVEDNIRTSYGTFLRLVVCLPQSKLLSVWYRFAQCHFWTSTEQAVCTDTQALLVPTIPQPVIWYLSLLWDIAALRFTAIMRSQHTEPNLENSFSDC